MRKDGKEARRKLKVEAKVRDEKIFRFPRKSAILFIDMKILSFALTFHDFFFEKPQFLESGNRPETSWIFYTAHRNLTGR